MHNHKKILLFIRFLEALASFLSVFFWLFLLLGFDGLHTASLTVAAALIHELGHEIALILIGKAPQLPRPRLNGFRINARDMLSYKDEMLVCVAGPLANVAVWLVGISLCPEWAQLFSVVNLITALSNLLPLRGYDGYRMIAAVLGELGWDVGRRILDSLSFFIATAALFISLYFIDRLDAGYWIFGGFFIFLLKEMKISINA